MYTFKKRRTTCPICGGSGFAEFQGDFDTLCGHCHSCGQTIFPDSKEKFEPKFEEKKDRYFLPQAVFDELKRSGITDNFRLKLLEKFPQAIKTLIRYQVLSNGKYTGFPYITFDKRIISVKYMEYGANLKRVKKTKDGETYSSIFWEHSKRINNETQYFKACWFGEQFALTNEFEYFGVVESEKSAILASIFIPNVCFLACGSKSTIKNLVYKGLNEKKVILYPDQDGVEPWADFVAKNGNPKWVCSKLPNGWSGKEDIADILLSNSREKLLLEIQEELKSAWLSRSEILEPKNWTLEAVQLPDRLQTKYVVCAELMFEKYSESLKFTPLGWFWFCGTHWKKIERNEIINIACKLFVQCGCPRNRIFEINEKNLIERQIQDIFFSNQSNSDGLNLRNCSIYFDEDGVLQRSEHSSKLFYTYVLDYDYNENLTTENTLFEQFLNTSLPDAESQNVLAEFVGSCLCRRIKHEKALFLYGRGSNGKSVFYDIIVNMLGKVNVSGIGIDQLFDKNRYFLGAIDGKLLNYASEKGGQNGINEDMWQQLVSGEPVVARDCGEKPRELTQYSRFAFNANTLPNSHDGNYTYAFFRRFLIIPFEKQITKEQRNPFLAKSIIKDELPIVLNWAIAGLNRLVSNGLRFSDCEKSDACLENFSKSSDSISAWFEDGYEVVTERDSYTLFADAYKSYRSYCYENGFKVTSSITFGNRVLYLGVDKVKMGANVCYLGLKRKTASPVESTSISMTFGNIDENESENEDMPF